MASLFTNHYVRLVAEALLAGIVAFGITYQATGNMQAALIAAMLAMMNKAAPQVTSNAAAPVVTASTPIKPK